MRRGPSAVGVWPYSRPASRCRPGGATPRAGAAVAGAPRPRSSVRFDVEESPALTPTWKSASWNRAPAPARGRGADGTGAAVDASPELRDGGGAGAAPEDDPEWANAEAKADRSW